MLWKEQQEVATVYCAQVESLKLTLIARAHLAMAPQD